MVYLIFHTAIIINRKNWRVTIKLHFEILSIFFKSERTHMLGHLPPPVCFCSLFNDSSLPSSTNVLFEWPLIPVKNILLWCLIIEFVWDLICHYGFLLCLFKHLQKSIAFSVFRKYLTQELLFSSYLKNEIFIKVIFRKETCRKELTYSELIKETKPFQEGWNSPSTHERTRNKMVAFEFSSLLCMECRSNFQVISKKTK